MMILCLGDRAIGLVLLSWVLMAHATFYWPPLAKMNANRPDDDASLPIVERIITEERVFVR